MLAVLVQTDYIFPPSGLVMPALKMSPTGWALEILDLILHRAPQVNFPGHVIVPRLGPLVKLYGI